MPENFVDLARSQLAADLDDPAAGTVESFWLTDDGSGYKGQAFPLKDFDLWLPPEVIHVTSRTGAHITQATRGAHGTQPVGHQAGQVAFHTFLAHHAIQLFTQTLAPIGLATGKTIGGEWPNLEIRTESLDETMISPHAEIPRRKLDLADRWGDSGKHCGIPALLGDISGVQTMVAGGSGAAFTPPGGPLSMAVTVPMSGNMVVVFSDAQWVSAGSSAGYILVCVDTVGNVQGHGLISIGVGPAMSRTWRIPLFGYTPGDQHTIIIQTYCEAGVTVSRKGDAILVGVLEVLSA